MAAELLAPHHDGTRVAAPGPRRRVVDIVR
jgi:hypothetical protein